MLLLHHKMEKRAIQVRDTHMHNWAAVGFRTLRDPLRRKQTESFENSEPVQVFEERSLGSTEASECLLFRRFGRTGSRV